ncbi:thiosulfate oxidation carrier protein SoxY [Fretibacter rubidus]|uniref:thiosulfate oxidation carrier protein SoxY n=1 Tax=Fretibacter rubidus TaxID=570162 RepID=UPI00352BB782
MSFSRRDMLKAGSISIALSALPTAVFATAERLSRIKAVFGEREIDYSGVTITIPPIAENGYSVPCRVTVKSPMTVDNFVKRIVIISERNPVAEVVSFTLTPASGRAKVDTRIRLGGSQILTAVAEMNDGTLHAGTAKAVVTLAACVVL